MLHLVDVSVSHGARTLFRDVSVQLVPGRRIALVGANGVGKTTLLELVVGTREPDAGTVTRHNDVTIGYLPQEAASTSTRTVLDEVLAGADVTHLEARLRELERLLEDPSADHDAVLTEYGRVQHRHEQLGGYGIEAEAQRILAGLGFAPDDGDRAVRELSGGWRTRVALAQLLMRSPDVLVLDEPTNHLDLDATTWLEQALAEHPGAVLFVSHDRDFIDAVADRVVEIIAGRAEEYVGGFAEFVVEREERQQRLAAAAAQQQREIAQVERFIERFRYKASKARQVQSRVKTLDKLDRIEVPDRRALKARFGFPAPPRANRVVAELSGVSRSFGDHVVLRDVDLVIERGQRVAVVGPNGGGKTTLLRLLLGDLEPDTGTATLGAQTVAAVFGQHQADELDPTRTVLGTFQQALGERHRGVNPRSLLGAFGFPGDAAERSVGVLSGGERTRLALAAIMVNPVNLLCLDEPTNHLDLASRDILADALEAWDGTSVIVSHDRHLLRAVADVVLEVRDGRVRRWHDIDEALAARDAALSTGGPPGSRPSGREDRKAQRRREAAERRRRDVATGELRRQLQRVERDLTAAEAEIADLNRQLAEPGVYEDGDRVRDLVAAHGAAKDRAADLMAAWERAQEALDRAEAALAHEA